MKKGIVGAMAVCSQCGELVRKLPGYPEGGPSGEHVGGDECPYWTRMRRGPLSALNTQSLEHTLRVITFPRQ